ncbi:unnamed protein product, partial [Mesorhabditis spiculigera]
MSMIQSSEPPEDADPQVQCILCNVPFGLTALHEHIAVTHHALIMYTCACNQKFFLDLLALQHRIYCGQTLHPTPIVQPEYGVKIAVIRRDFSDSLMRFIHVKAREKCEKIHGIKLPLRNGRQDGVTAARPSASGDTETSGISMGSPGRHGAEDMSPKPGEPSLPPRLRDWLFTDKESPSKGHPATPMRVSLTRDSHSRGRQSIATPLSPPPASVSSNDLTPLRIPQQIGWRLLPINIPPRPKLCFPLPDEDPRRIIYEFLL